MTNTLHTTSPIDSIPVRIYNRDTRRWYRREQRDHGSWLVEVTELPEGPWASETLATGRRRYRIGNRFASRAQVERVLRPAIDVPAEIVDPIHQAGTWVLRAVVAACALAPVALVASVVA